MPKHGLNKSESLQNHVKHARNIFKSSPIHAWMIPKSCWIHAQNIPETCPSYIRIMPDTCPKYARIIYKSWNTYPNNSRTIHESYLIHARSMPEGLHASSAAADFKHFWMWMWNVTAKASGYTGNFLRSLRDKLFLESFISKGDSS